MAAASRACLPWARTARPLAALACALALALPAAAAAAHEPAPEDEWLFDDEEALEADPLEPANRPIFATNEQIYAWVFDPLADLYGCVVPRPVRSSVRHFFTNLQEPSVVVNELLRGEWNGAGSTSLRFVVNSTVGVAGLFDPAARWGFAGHQADFGETLAVYGVADGPYLVVPLLGPTTLRDALGGLVDAALRLDTWFLAAGPLVVVTTGNGLSTYETERIHLDELRKSSIDFYAALRSAYRMERAAHVRELRARHAPPEDDLGEIPAPGQPLR